jgi:pyruvate kinase
LLLLKKIIGNINFGIGNDVNFCCRIVCKKPSDVVQIKRLLEKYGGQENNVIAKNPVTV